ncbi:TPA: hypothetical protein DCX15_04560 [bacterium]|nr:hypothetical protein [bacterium]
MSEGSLIINQLVAGVIFGATLILILSERLHRVIAAMSGAALMVILGMKFGFYSPDEAMAAVDFNTLGLLIGMMIIVAHLKRTGLFNFLAIKSAKVAKGNPRYLLATLGIATAFVSMFLDNVTTIILMAPITILMADALGISPLPFLMTETLLSNIGGVGTLIGDPPNIIIGSSAGLGFNDFIIHLMPLAIVTIGGSLLTLNLVFNKELKIKPKNIRHILSLDEYEAIRSARGLKRCLVVLGGVILLFFFHQQLEIPSSFVALIGASIILLFIRPDPEEILKDVDWSVVFFFTALFVLVGGIERTGILTLIRSKVEFLGTTRMVLSSLLLLWISALSSSIIGNIPFTMIMTPIIKHIATGGANVNPLWWSLALGVGFGGNGTPIGATVNVMAISLSEKTKYPISSKEWIKIGSTVTLTSLTIATLFLAFLPALFK